MILQIIEILLWFVLIPACLGLSLTRIMNKEWRTLPMIMLGGYFIMFSVFQLIYIFFLLYYNQFEPLVLTYSIVIITMAVLSFLFSIRFWIVELRNGYYERPRREKKTFACYLLWFLFLALLAFQFYKLFAFQFLDGDDSFYAVESVLTVEKNNMYVNIPYTGETSELDTRHGFSSQPIFLSFLSKVLSIHPTIVTHSMFPYVIIAMFYMIYYMIAKLLLPEKKENAPLFLIFISIMNIFGNSTIYTAATFLITRTSQGKAFLANIIPAAAILGLLMVWKNVKEDEPQKVLKAGPWLFLMVVMITAVYTSMMGIFLAPLIIGGATFLLTIAYKRIQLLVPCMLSMLPLLVMGVFYLKAL